MNKRYRAFSNLAHLTGVAGLITPLLAAGCGGEDPPARPVLTDEAEQELAFPGRTGEIRRGVFDTPYGQQELTYELIDGQAVFEGDILLTPSEPDYRAGGVSAMGRRWPSAVVPFEPTGLFNDSRVVAAMKHWEDRTSLRFVVSSTNANRLRFVQPNDDSCSSAVGVAGGVQTVNIGTSCSTGNTIHEIGHAIGLFHEQSRTDRDQFVRVIWNCIQSGQSHNFNMFGSDGMNMTRYDLTSIMHYGSTAFLNTNPGCTATLTRLDGSTFAAQRTALTADDVEGATGLYHPWTTRVPAVDWDGDARPELAVWRPSNGWWFIKRSTDGVTIQRQWGAQNDVPVPGDYDNDRRGDFAVFRPSTGDWLVINSSNGSTSSVRWGLLTSIPVPGDYNGDRVTDRAVWDAQVAVWGVKLSAPASGTIDVQWGAPGDIPVPSDYDGDGIADIAVWRRSNGTWYVISSRTGGSIATQWGAPGDIPVPADYDGDGSSDRMIWRPSERNYYLLRSSDGSTSVHFVGINKGDTPVPADYNGDGKAEWAIKNWSSGTWHIYNSVVGATAVRDFGLAGDVPTP